MLTGHSIMPRLGQHCQLFMHGITRRGEGSRDEKAMERSVYGRYRLSH